MPETDLSNAPETDSTVEVYNPLEDDFVLVDDEKVDTEEEAEEKEEAPEEEKAEEVEEKESEKAEESDELDVENIFKAPKEKEEEIKDSSRDYEGFDDEDKKYAKQMSNDAYEHFQVKLKSLKSDKVDLNGHPDGYSLNPEYQKTLDTYGKAQREQAHWKKQLINIRNGEAWKGLDGYDNEGNLTSSRKEYKPTANAEIDVQAALTESGNIMRDLSSKANQIKSNHSTMYKDAVDLLDKEQEKQFAWLQDEKIGKQQVDIPQIGRTTINKLKKNFVSSIPQVVRNNPMTELAANLFVTTQILGKQQSLLTEKLKKYERNKKDKLRSEPTSNKTTVGDDEMFELDALMEDLIL